MQSKAKSRVALDPASAPKTEAASPKPLSNRRLYASAVFLVLCVSFLIRVGGIPHHEPIILHVDEHAFVGRAIRIVTTGDFNPHWFGHPGSLTIYCLAALYALTGFFGGIDAKELAERYAFDPTPFHVLGKYFVALSSMCTQWGLLLLARQFLGRWQALLAVALLACSQLDIELSTTIRTDTQQSLLLVLLTLALLRAVQSGKHGWFVTSGVLLGLATAVKWPSAVACLSIVLSAVLANHKPGQPPAWRRAGVQVGLAAAASVIGLFAVAPYVLLDFATVLKDVSTESRSYHMSATSRGVLPALAYYVGHLGGIAGKAALVLAAVGAIMSLRGEQRRLHIVPLSMFVSYLLFLCTLNLNWPRWTVPLLPYPCLYVVIGLVNVAQKVQKHVRWPWASGAIVGACSVVLILVSGAHVKAMLFKRAHDDVYDATQWVVRHVPRGSKLLVEDGAPYLPQEMFEFYEARGNGRIKHVVHSTKYHAPRGKLMELRDMKAAVRSVDYVILGNVYKRLQEERSRYRRQIAEYDWVKRHTQLAQRFGLIEVRRVKNRDQ